MHKQMENSTEKEVLTSLLSEILVLILFIEHRNKNTQRHSLKLNQAIYCLKEYIMTKWNFTPGNEWVNTWKSLEDKEYTHLNSCRNTLWQNPTSISDFKKIFKLRKPGIEENFCKLTKSHHKKPKASTIFHGEWLNVFP